MIGNIYTFVIDIPIVAKGRSRSTIVKSNKCVNGITIRHYTPNKTKEFEQELSLVVKRKMMAAGFELAVKRPMWVGIEFLFSKDTSKGQEFHTKRPDLDNLVKSTKDALNKVLYWDDSYVCKMSCDKGFNIVNKDKIIIKFKYLK